MFLVAVASSAMVLNLAAQAPASPRFDAASVKPNTSGSDNGFRNLGAGGRMVFQNMSLVQIITAAYGIESYQLSGGPAWISSTRFDITATAGTAAPLEQLNLMLRTLLAERFKLVVHMEQREMATYVLTRARQDGQLGPAMKRATADCGPTGRGAGPGPTEGCTAWIGPGTIDFGGQPISQLAGALGMMMRGPVIDKTGLTGGYDIKLAFSFEGLPGMPLGPPGGAGPPVDPNKPTLFAALPEQAGLRLESQRGPVPIVVIDSVSQPTPD